MRNDLSFNCQFLSDDEVYIEVYRELHQRWDKHEQKFEIEKRFVCRVDLLVSDVLALALELEDFLKAYAQEAWKTDVNSAKEFCEIYKIQ